MSTLLCKNSVLRIYQEVMEDVISGVREVFLEDGVDEQVLQELKQTWETKLMSTKAVQEEQVEKKKVEHNGFPKVVNNPVQQTVSSQPSQQPHPQQLLQQHIQHDKLVPIQITLPPQPGSDGLQRILTIQVPASALQGNQLQKVLTGPVITATMGLPSNIASSLLQQHVNAAFNSHQQATVTTIVNKNVIQTDGAADQDDLDFTSACSSKGNCEEPSDRKQTDEAGCLVRDEEGLCIEVIFPKIRRRKAKKYTSLNQADGPNDTSDDDEDGSDDENDDDDLDDDRDEDDQEMEDEGGEEEPLNSEDDVTDDDPTDLFDTDNIVVCQYDKIIRNRNRWKFYLKDGIMNLKGADYVFQKATGDAEW
ncbi:transcription factor IIA L isoform X2 [Leptinotarsa decemlineata]|uniref:transcription factor IIA L isoform X2 n=1 Tax=Leptinotarsa decemlineata TaxID=7539 RepID=UPI000C252213|nr:transcription initiation factor IIA subunit 1-like isoform X2 [Leptinotarsa decemlineata]